MTRDLTFERPIEGDTSKEIVYAAVGYALTQWEDLEAELCSLYGAFNGWQPVAYSTIRGYSSGNIFRERLKTVVKAGGGWFRQHCDQAREGLFCSLMNQAVELSYLRNKLAHSTVGYSIPPIASGTTERIGEQGYTYYLVPTFYNEREQKFFSEDYLDFRPSYIFVSMQIREFGDRFGRLRNEVSNFRKPINRYHEERDRS